MKNLLMTFSAILALACLAVLLPAPAQAAMISTDEVIATQDAQADREKVKEFLGRADVEKKLQDMDVPANVARKRVDALTAEEAATLAKRIDALPAGGALSGTDFIIILLVAILVAILL
ncbi:PA2779 family protein [Pseudomonas indica]|jgi:hypothetical protein|uniref:PA2779 family protein n=1 Tax=Pseudomonas indica TaxID=137658 RepID=UPI000BAB5E19|nr:PA2779 family protein [Pseudomonas indica]MBU3057118.1 PA2779 family protein [Pseudomonas indica]PAU62118.1 hypothetical protein BZL42_07120 [Pseudomonas indica]